MEFEGGKVVQFGMSFGLVRPDKRDGLLRFFQEDGRHFCIENGEIKFDKTRVKNFQGDRILFTRGETGTVANWGMEREYKHLSQLLDTKKT